MNLSPEQQELLGAYMDDELSAPERALAKALLEREEARRYLNEISRVKAALAKHLPAPAPSDFRAGVLAALEGDFDSISRPTGQRQPAAGQVLTGFNWKTPFMAVAAAVIVAVGLLFGGVLFDPAPHQGPDSRFSPVALEATGDSPTSRKKEFSDALGTEGKHPPEHSPAEPGSSGGTTPKSPDNKSESGKGIPGTDKHPAPPPTNDGNDGKTKGSDNNYERDRRNGEIVQHLFDADELNATEISLCYNRASSATLTQLYTELLSVSSLYGRASIEANAVAYNVVNVGTDFTLYRGVSIEIDEARIPELLAALERLSAGNNFGRVVLPAYLRRDVSRNMREVEQLQAQVQALERGEMPTKPQTPDAADNWSGKDEARREKADQERRASDPSSKRAVGYLPTDVQRENVKRLEGELRGKATAGGAKVSSNTETGEVPVLKARKSGPVRLVIRIQ